MAPEICALQLLLEREHQAQQSVYPSFTKTLVSNSQIYIIYLLDFEQKLSRLPSSFVYFGIVAISTILLTFTVNMIHRVMELRSRGKYKIE